MRVGVPQDIARECAELLLAGLLPGLGGVFFAVVLVAR
jgi:hypothetical protein